MDKIIPIIIPNLIFSSSLTATVKQLNTTTTCHNVKWKRPTSTGNSHVPSPSGLPITVNCKVQHCGSSVMFPSRSNLAYEVSPCAMLVPGGEDEKMIWDKDSIASHVPIKIQIFHQRTKIHQVSSIKNQLFHGRKQVAKCIFCERFITNHSLDLNAIIGFFHLPSILC